MDEPHTSFAELCTQLSQVHKRKLEKKKKNRIKFPSKDFSKMHKGSKHHRIFMPSFLMHFGNFLPLSQISKPNTLIQTSHYRV